MAVKKQGAGMQTRGQRIKSHLLTRVDPKAAGKMLRGEWTVEQKVWKIDWAVNKLIHQTEDRSRDGAGMVSETAR